MARQGIATLEDPEAFLGFGGNPMLPAGAPSVSDRAADMIRLMESGLPTGRPFSALVGDKDNLRVTRNPYEILADRQRQSGDLAVGMGLGLTADIAGLPADMLALIFSDAPKFAAALATGTPFSEMPTNVADDGLRALRNVLGSDAIAGYLGVTEEALQRPGIESGRILSSIVDPLVLGAALRKFIPRTGVQGPRSTDELAAAAAADAVARLEDQGDMAAAAAMEEDAVEAFGGVPAPQAPPGAPRAPEDGPDLGVGDAEAGDGAGGFFPTDQPGEPVVANDAARAADLRGTPAEYIADQFDDHLNSPLVDEDALMDTVMSYGDGSASRVVADALGIPREDVTSDVLFLIRGRNMGDFQRQAQPAQGIEQLAAPDQGEVPFTDDDAVQPGQDLFGTLALGNQQPGLTFVESADGQFTFAPDVTQETIDSLNGPGVVSINPDMLGDVAGDGVSVFNYVPLQNIPNNLTTNPGAQSPFNYYEFGEDMYDLTGRRIPAGSRIAWPEQLQDDFFNFFTSSPPRVDTPPEQGPIPPEALPPADPNTGSQLMSTTALNQRVLDIDPTQPFAPVAPADSVRVAGSSTDPLREGRIADYSPLRQLIYSLPDDRPLGKAEIIEALSLDRGSTAYQKSLRNDLKGSGFLEWLETHGADEMMRGTLEVKYEELAPQVRAKNVVAGDGDALQALFGYRQARLPHQGMQNSVPEEYVIQNPNATNRNTDFMGQIYFSNPNSAAVNTRTNTGSTGITGIRTGRGGGIGDHGGMSAGGGRAFVDAPYGERGVPGYFGHLRYSVIEDSAGRKMMVLQEVQSNNVVQQNKLLSNPINALEDIQRRLEKNLRQMRNPDFDNVNLPSDVSGIDEAGLQQLIDSVKGIVQRAKQTKQRYDRDGIPTEGTRQDIDTLLRRDPDTGAIRPSFAGFRDISVQIDRATENIYNKLHGEDERVFLTPKMKEDAELIASDGALYDALRNAEKANISFDRFANVLDRSGLNMEDVPDLARLEGEFDARAPVAEMILAANDVDTISRVFNFRSRSYNGNYQQRMDVIVNSIANTTDPDLIRKFNTAMNDRLDQVLTIDGTAVDDVDMIRMELGLGNLRGTDAADAPALREAFQNLLEARQNGMTPHEYFTARTPDGFITGSGSADLNTLLTKDPSNFGYITHRGDPGDPLMAVNAAQEETDVITEASDVFDFIVKEALTKDAGAAQANVAIPDGMTPKRFQELRKVFRASRETINSRPGGFDTDTPFANTTHYETFAPRFLVQEARRMGLDGVIFPSSDDMLTAGRGAITSRGETRARFKRQYGTHVDQGLKDMGVEVVDLPTILAKNQSTGNIEPMRHREGTNAGRTQPIHTNARAVYFNNDTNARLSDPNTLIRRAKGGPVDLRPKKLVHSGIGAMAKQVM